MKVTDCPTAGEVGLKLKSTVSGSGLIVMLAVLNPLEPFASVAVALTMCVPLIL